MTDSRSPRLKPSAASPRANSRTWSWYWPHVQVCQMPRSFSRIAGRSRRSRTVFCSSLARVVGSATAGIPQGCFDDERIGPHVVGRAFSDLLAPVEHRDAGGDVHDHAHVVLDQDHSEAPLLLDVGDEARPVLF